MVRRYFQRTIGEQLCVPARMRPKTASKRWRPSAAPRARRDEPRSVTGTVTTRQLLPVAAGMSPHRCRARTCHAGRAGLLDAGRLTLRSGRWVAGRLAGGWQAPGLGTVVPSVAGLERILSSGFGGRCHGAGSDAPSAPPKPDLRQETSLSFRAGNRVGVRVDGAG
ncbi:hypothetical protein [Streptomyces decoyicus]|uniref:hypothetical protein n=1 Tax=Streptomyces decoyicus TaxID=249567 RepID=UPI00386B799E